LRGKTEAETEVSVVRGEDRRRSQRVIIRVPVTLTIVKSGQNITVSAHTVAVNVHGAMVLSPRPITAETRLQVSNDRTGQAAMARVTRVPRETGEGYLVPLEFDVASPSFWQISFPPEGPKT